MMIPKLYARSRVTEADSALKLIIVALEKGDFSSDIYLTGIVVSLKEESQQLTSAIKRLSTESSLESLDTVRDRVLRSLYHLVFGYTHHPDALVQKSALTVLAHFEQYGVAIVNESYAIESSLINSMLNNFKAISQPIENLSGVSELLEKLTQAQIAFEQELQEYMSKKAEESRKLSASEIKLVVVKSINTKLVMYLRAMCMVDESKYGTVSLTIAGIIKSHNNRVKKRAKSNS